MIATFIGPTSLFGTLSFDSSTISLTFLVLSLVTDVIQCRPCHRPLCLYQHQSIQKFYVKFMETTTIKKEFHGIRRKNDGVSPTNPIRLRVKKKKKQLWRKCCYQEKQKVDQQVANYFMMRT